MEGGGVTARFALHLTALARARQVTGELTFTLVAVRAPAKDLPSNLAWTPECE